VTTESLVRVDPREFAARRDAIAALDARACAIDGHESLGDAVWRDLSDPGADSAGFFLDDRAYAHVARVDRADAEHWNAALVRLPEARDAASTAALLYAAVAHAAEHGAFQVTSWVLGGDDGDEATFTAAGFRLDRALYEMRVPLPITAAPPSPDGITLRPFEPGRDDAAWLRVNNRAFAGHAEQGGWTEATLRGRMSEPWFDPSAFLLAFDADGLAGSNWLKWHAPRGGDPALGEIYVIAVDPRMQGTGLGRWLAVEGLQRMYERGAAAGMLFVAADNEGALALYQSLGFVVHRTDRAYVHDVPTTRGRA
jgi:mycothiol synthase